MRQGTLSVGEFLTLAIPLTRLIGHLHAQGKLHGRLRPEVLGVDEREGRAWVSEVDSDSEPPSSGSANSLASLPYLAPELSGRTSHRPDQRADLYALGCVFFELLAGRPPFEERDPVAMMHAHLASPPPTLRGVRPEMPWALGGVLGLLLGKRASDRYRSVLGLLQDLLRIEAVLSRGEVTDTLPIGQHDPSPWAPPRRLGREAQLGVFERTLDRVAEGSAELLLVRGPEEADASRLIGELTGLATKRGWMAVQAAFHEGSHAPYETLASMLEELGAQIRREPEETQSELRRGLLSAVGVCGQLLIDLAPGLAQLMGAQPEVEPLPPLEAQTRFAHVFGRFVRAAATGRRPLLVVLDAAHLADEASLRLLRMLFGGAHLLVTCVSEASRDEDLRAQLGALVEHVIEVPPLDLPATAALIAEVLDESPEHLHELAAEVFRRSSGSPTRTTLLLQLWSEQGLLRIDPERGGFAYDVADLARSATGPASLTPDRVRDLPARALQILGALALTAGEVFSSQALAGFDLCSPDELAATIELALRRGVLLERTEPPLPLYSFADAATRRRCLSLLDVDARLRVLRWLLRDRERAVPLDDRVFELAYAFGEARLQARLATLSERTFVFGLYVRAGRRAKQAGASAAAELHLRQASELLQSDPALVVDVAERLALLRDLIEVTYVVRSEGEAERLLAHALEGATPSEQARLRGLRVAQLTRAGRFADAIQEGFLALRLLDSPVPTDPSSWAGAVPAALVAAVSVRGEAALGSFASAPVAEHARVHEEMHLLSLLSQPAYNHDSNLFTLLVLRMVALSLEQGVTGSSAYGFATYAILLGAGLGDLASGEASGDLARRLASRFGVTAELGRVLHLHTTFVRWWRDELSATITPLRQARELCLESGDLIYAGLAAIVVVMHRLGSGESLGAIRTEAHDLLASTRKHGDATTEAALTVVLAHLDALAADDPPPDLAADPAVIAHLTDARLSFALGWLRQLEVERLVLDASPRARAAAAVAEPLLGSSFGLSSVPRFRFFQGLALCLDDQQPAAERRELLGPIAQDLAAWGQRSPDTFGAFAAVLDSGLRRLDGDLVGAREAGEHALSLARRTHDLLAEAVAHERLASLLHAQGAEAAASAHIYAGCAALQAWGSPWLARSLSERYSYLTRSLPVPVSTRDGRVDALDTLSVLKAAQAIAGDLDRSKVVERLLHIVMQNAGADTADLILVEDGQLRLGASAARRQTQVFSPPVALASHPDLPVSVLEHVLRHRRPLLLADASREGAFLHDPVLRGKRSVLAVPLIAQSRLEAIVYLENRLVEAAFGPQRVELLQLLSGMGATAIANARLYGALQSASSRLEDHSRTLERRVEERTRLLSERNHDLSLALSQVRETEARLRVELDEAAGYVRSLLPATTDSPLWVRWLYQPSAELGGDGFGYHALDDDHVALYVLDVCGHGVASALLSVTILSTLRSGRLQGASPRSPASVLHALNTAFPATGGMYFTIWYGVFDRRRARLRFGSAAHPGALLFSPRASTARELATRGSMIGISPESSFEEDEVEFAQGSHLFAFTDGAYEIETADGSMLPYDAFLEQMSHARRQPDPLRHMLRFVTDRARGHVLPDDLSMLLVR